jgi:acyl-CoA reductase-like NAD-dependent aldehyde dehydrogenase
VVEQYAMYIDGAWTASASGETIDSVNPWTQQVWAQVPSGTEHDIDRAVAAARRAFEDTWWPEDVQRRGQVLRRLADLIEAEVEHIATIEGRDNGKIVSEERAMCANIAGYFRYNASLAETIPDSAPVGQDSAVFAVTRRVPYGVIGIQTPWNTPGILLAQSAAPALAAGNTIVVKPSEIASCSTLELARIAEQAGFPPGVLNIVTGYGPVVGARLCNHPDVAKLVFTGSTEAGRLIATQAAGHLTQVVSELGGKGVNVVFADCPPGRAAHAIVKGFTTASGQTCMCNGRALIAREIYDEVLDRVLGLAAALKLGDPFDPSTDMGPMISAAQVRRVQRFVDGALGEGARLLCGGGPPAAMSHPQFFAPTIFADVTTDMTIWREEIFGPVLAVVPFDSEDEAVKLANDTDYGLSTAIWTNDLARAHRVVKRIRAGMVWVNEQRRGDPAFAGGGIGKSGCGRLSGVEGFWEMSRTKNIQMFFDEHPA